jgi:hypothetical protein
MRDDESVECLYPDCKEVPTCRAEDPEYSYHEYHGRGWPKSEDGKCPSPFAHKYVCDKHWDLVQFLKAAEVFTIDVTLK